MESFGRSMCCAHPKRIVFLRHLCAGMNYIGYVTAYNAIGITSSMSVLAILW